MRHPDIFLPPFKVEHVVTTLSQVEDWGIRQLNVPKTWTITEGEDIVVMVLDTGFTDHTDLIGAMNKKDSRNCIEGESTIMDGNGHSTHVCGIIGARHNDIGMVGVAPKCTIVTVRVLGDSGGGTYEEIANGLKYAIRTKPDIVSMSLGAPVDKSVLHDPIKELYKLNIPVICAAGNDGRSDAVNYPGKYPETICVTAFDSKGNPARFNSTGSMVDFSAPGVDIYSTYLNNQYAKLSGTSMATPFITGLVALLLAKHRKQEAETGMNDCKTIEQIKEHLIKYADDKGIVGKDAIWGYGVIDPEKLIFSSGADEPIISIPKTEPTGILGWLRKVARKVLWSWWN